MTAFAKLDQTNWMGTCELWLDPLGDEVSRSACSLRIEGDTLHYEWHFKDKAQQGSIAVDANGTRFTDTFHSAEPMICRPLSEAWGLLSVQGEYGDNHEWRWRIGVYHRTPTGQLVVQMTNVAPWGEEARAVRMIADLT